MAENVVYVKGNRQQVRRLIGKAVAIASGSGAGAQEAADQMQIRMGQSALNLIRDAFVIKSKGNADESGLKWPALSPKTIAYSRRHFGVPKSVQRAPFRPSWMLTDKQRKRWWDLYRIGLARFNGDRSSAAKMAWKVLKDEGAKTLIGTYGNESVLILRDIGLLLNTLSPGVAPGTVQNQVFRVGRGEVIVGTNRVGAASHHTGIPGRLPQRRLWPEPGQWPASWWADIAEQGRQGYIDILLSVLKGSV